MKTMVFSIIFGFIMFLFVLLIPMSLLVMLQVWLCKKGRRLGLILPALSLLMSLLLVLSMGAFTRAGVSHISYDESGNVTYEEHYDSGWQFATDKLLPITAVFLVGNIPTAVFGGIWLHYKGRRDTQDALERMRIEDLE